VQIELSHLAAILAMAVATYATRIGGFLLVRSLRPGPNLQTALEALPVAVLTAVIAPALAKGGIADLGAAGVTLVAALRLPLLAAVIVGVATAVVLRSAVGA
jgi:uncharacterized membrane protein